ncbi:uncharacterized protein LOC135499652 [Lineus longissimus]|uniref:uncharacterized protein LOC135499652 n=1 Tax=Lineus longissimus TaxID=88925 RepID=UPI002B4EBF22
MESEIATLLNLNANDRDNLSNLVGEFFGESWIDDQEDVQSDLDDGEESDEDEFDQTSGTFDSVMNSQAAAEYKECNAGDFGQAEWEKSSKFSCTCKHNDGQPCHQRYTAQDKVHRRMAMMQLTPREQMLVLLGKLSCGINSSEMTAKSRRKEQTPWKLNQKTTFWLEGQRICRDTFMFLHVIGSPKRLTDHRKWT